MTTTHVFWVMLVTMAIPAVIEYLRANRTKGPWVPVAVVLIIMGSIVLPIMTRTNVVVVVIITAVTVGTNATLAATIGNRNLARTITMVFNILIAVFAVGHPSVTPGFNGTTTEIARGIAANPVAGTIGPRQIHIVVVALAGSYLAAIEANHPIALMLKGTNLMPPSPSDNEPRDALEIDEPARGKVIGYLERIIVFLLVLTGNLNAIGYVLVAKGIARFQQLDDRGFAEYFLIGTLMSIVGAALIGVTFRAFV